MCAHGQQESERSCSRPSQEYAFFVDCETVALVAPTASVDGCAYRARTRRASSGAPTRSVRGLLPFRALERPSARRSALPAGNDWSRDDLAQRRDRGWLIASTTRSLIGPAQATYDDRIYRRVPGDSARAAETLFAASQCTRRPRRGGAQLSAALRLMHCAKEREL